MAGLQNYLLADFSAGQADRITVLRIVQVIEQARLFFHRVGDRGQRGGQHGLNRRRQHGVNGNAELAEHHIAEAWGIDEPVELPLLQLRQLGGFLHRVVEIAQLIDQAVSLGVAAEPDVALRDLVNLLRGHLARFGD